MKERERERERRGVDVETVSRGKWCTEVACTHSVHQYTTGGTNKQKALTCVNTGIYNIYIEILYLYIYIFIYTHI